MKSVDFLNQPDLNIDLSLLLDGELQYLANALPDLNS